MALSVILTPDNCLADVCILTQILAVLAFAGCLMDLHECQLRLLFAVVASAI